MKRLTTGLMLGGMTAVLGTALAMQDKRSYNKLMKKGKNMAVKAEEVVEDMFDQMTKS